MNRNTWKIIHLLAIVPSVECREEQQERCWHTAILQQIVTMTGCLQYRQHQQGRPSSGRCVLIQDVPSSLVFYECLHFVHQVSSHHQNLRDVVSLCHFCGKTPEISAEYHLDRSYSVCFESLTVKKLDDICEIHVVFEDNISVHFHKCQSKKEHKVFRGSVLGCPDGFPQGEHVVIDHLCQNGNSRIRFYSPAGRFVTPSRRSPLLKSSRNQR